MTVMDTAVVPSSLRIRLLGRFHVSVDDDIVDDTRWQRRGAKTLVKLLSLEPHHQLHREQLMDLLWPESTAHAAANSLNKVIHGARRALEPNLVKGSDSRFLKRRSDFIVLCAPGDLWIDVIEFEGKASDAFRLETIEAYESALSCYAGDLLEEDRYEEWLLGKRTELRTLFQKLTERLAHCYEENGRLEDSVARWSDVLRGDPHNESAHRHLMNLYMQSGRRQQALLQYERCRELIGEELGIEPEDATSRLYEEILNGRYQLRAPEKLTPRPNFEMEIDSIAVLPFENASGDSQLEYLCEGISDSLINGLARLPGLRVMARSTVFRYKNRELDPLTVGRELNVRGVIVGRVTQWTERLVVGTELIRVSDGSLLWGEQFNRASADIFSVQEQISQNISEQLRLKISNTDRLRLRKRHTHNTSAYQHYLKGRFHWNQRTGADLQKALICFDEAIKEDPVYALAYAGLADCYNVMSLYSVVPPREAMPKAKDAANSSLKIDESLAEAHTALAFCKLLYEWDWIGAEKAFQRAIELNSNYATAYHWYHVCLTAQGRFEDGAIQLKTAKTLDPLSLIIDTEFGWGLYLARRFDLAIQNLDRTLDMDPHFAVAHLILGMSYLQEQRFEQALSEIQKAIDLQYDAPFTLAIGVLGHGYARCGEPKRARTCLEELDSLSDSHFVSAYTRALVYAGLNEVESAFDWLDKAFEERYDRLVFLNVEPMFDVLRAHPAFERLVRRLGLA